MAQQRKTVFIGRCAPAPTAFLGGTLLALAACTGTPTPAPSLHSSPAAQTPVPAQNVAAAPATGDPAIARLPPPRTLKGLKPDEVVSLMGPPDFRRVDPPAELWQYRTADCILDVFFYHEDDGYRVSVAGTRSRIPGQAARCVTGQSASGQRSPQAPL